MRHSGEWPSRSNSSPSSTQLSRTDKYQRRQLEGRFSCRLSTVSVDRPQQLTDLLRFSHSRMVCNHYGSKRAPQVRCRITLCTPGCYGETKYLSGSLLRPVRSLMLAA